LGPWRRLLLVVARLLQLRSARTPSERAPAPRAHLPAQGGRPPLAPSAPPAGAQRLPEEEFRQVVIVERGCAELRAQTALRPAGMLCVFRAPRSAHGVCLYRRRGRPRGCGVSFPLAVRPTWRKQFPSAGRATRRSGNGAGLVFCGASESGAISYLHTHPWFWVNSVLEMCISSELLIARCTHYQRMRYVSPAPLEPPVAGGSLSTSVLPMTPRGR